jgi:hypothetical protein
MMLLGWLTAIGLVAIVTQMTARRDMPRRERPLWWFVYVWLTLILTGHVLSLFGMLNNPYLYCGAALALLAGVIWSFDRLAPINSAPLPLVALVGFNFPVLSPRVEKYGGYALAGLLLLAAACSLFLVLHNMPGNADSVSYRLPRAFWYTSHGSLLHPFEAYDKRTVFYPLNGTLLYVPLVVFGFPGTFHNLPTYLAWVVMALTCFCAARAVGAGRTLALLATALAALTPNILVQAAATNDEILAGCALLLGLYFMYRWLTTDQKIYLLLAATIVGISIGTKLHIVFYIPVLMIAVALGLAQAMRTPKMAQTLWRRVGWRTAAACVGLGLTMIVPFLIYNKISTGQFYFADDFAAGFFNTHGKLQVGLQNTLIYGAQMIVAPLADLYGLPDHADRENFHAMLNNFFRPLIAPWLSTDRADYHMQYSFTGITLGVSPYYLEYSLWAGFSYLLWPLLAWQAMCNRTLPLYGWWVLLTLSPLIWFVTWCASTLYMEGTPTYLAYYLIVAAPTVVFALLQIKRTWLSKVRWALIGFVLLTHGVIDANTYLYNEFRNIPRLLQSKRLPYDWELMDQSIIDEVKAATKIRIVFMHWGMSYFGFMQHNPHAFYYGPHEAVADLSDTLVLFSAASAEHWGFAPLYVPHKPNPGVTYLGRMRGWGPEGVFAAGNGVDGRWPDRNRFMLFSVKPFSDNGKFGLEFADSTAGYRADENLEFRYEIKHNNELLAARDWSRELLWRVQVFGDPLRSNDDVTIQVRLPGMTTPDADMTINLSGMREWTETMPGVHPWEEIGD